MPQEDQITGLQISGGIMCEKCTLETDNRCSMGGANCATPLHLRVMCDPAAFILLLRESFEGSEYVYTHGSCYPLHRMLALLFPGAIPFYANGHIITLIGGKFYDITGEVDGKGYVPHSEEHGCHANRFSLWDNGWECPKCDDITPYSELCT